jgi:hypothetical protein
LSVSVNDQAACFFLANFVLVPRGGYTRGYLGFLIPLLSGESKNSTLTLAFSAVTLAAFGNRPNSKTTQSLADDQYAKALNAVNKAIQDPKKIVQDSVLAAVVLLGMFEVNIPFSNGKEKTD